MPRGAHHRAHCCYGLLDLSACCALHSATPRERCVTLIFAYRASDGVRPQELPESLLKVEYLGAKALRLAASSSAAADRCCTSTNAFPASYSRSRGLREGAGEGTTGFVAGTTTGTCVGLRAGLYSCLLTTGTTGSAGWRGSCDGSASRLSQVNWWRDVGDLRHGSRTCRLRPDDPCSTARSCCNVCAHRLLVLHASIVWRRASGLQRLALCWRCACLSGYVAELAPHCWHTTMRARSHSDSTAKRKRTGFGNIQESSSPCH